MIQSNVRSAAETNQAAMFVDYDNLYSILKAQSGTNRSTSAYAIEIFEEVSRYLEEGDDTPTIYGRAYGAFDTMLDEEDTEVPSDLHRRGIEPVYVPDQMQDNTAEMRLSIDLAHFLDTRADVQTLVIVTGNRPYLPLARRIREEGRRALVAAVNPPQTPDAPSFVEDSLYLDARNLLSQDSREVLLANAPENGAAYTQASGGGNPTPSHYQSLTNPIARRTVEITEKHFGQYDEVYLTPLLRKLSDILGPDHDPKSLVSELEAAGAVWLEKRNGYPYNYTVLIVNDEHPDVQDIREDVSPLQHSTNGDSADDSASDPDRRSTDSVRDADGAPDYDERTIDDALTSDGASAESAETGENAEENSPEDASEDEFR